MFEESPKVFQSLGANQVPFIFCVNPETKVSLQSMTIPKNDRMSIDNVRAKYPWTAEVCGGLRCVRELRMYTHASFG